MQTITPFLWFDGQAEQAAKFYVSVFEKNSKILQKTHYTEGTHGKVGSVLTVKFRIMGQEFVALNGGPMYKFTPATSFFVNCRTQAEIDYYWRKLTSGGGKAVQCGWLEDKYGVSWQIVPGFLLEVLEGKDVAKSTRMMQALMKMTKLDLKKLRMAAADKK